VTSDRRDDPGQSQRSTEPLILRPGLRHMSTLVTSDKTVKRLVVDDRLEIVQLLGPSNSSCQRARPLSPDANSERDHSAIYFAEASAGD
jgi:hypothetical protein